MKNVSDRIVKRI